MKLPTILLYTAMVFYVVGVVLNVVGIYESWIIALIGSLLLAFVRIYDRAKSDKSKSSAPTRIPAILIFSASLMVFSAYLMYGHKSYWVLPVTIAAVLEFYASYRMPKE
ncbi:MAG: hypothetical protein Q4C30_01025 [Bacteroidia bacterium]|nr:hypothetical protein [Bacteroidia bacterium]